MKETIEVIKCDLCGKIDAKDDFYHIMIKGNLKDICPSCSNMISGNFCISKHEIYSTIIEAKESAEKDYELYNKTISNNVKDKDLYLTGISTMCARLTELID